MGGLAFSQSNNGELALHTPRMPPDVYYSEKATYLALLGKFYEKAISPVEAPEKVDYGDIDILVESPRYNFTATDLARALHAVRHVRNSVTTSFAVPYPGCDDTLIQLDVHVCQPALTEWTSFLNSYGDLQQIIGVTLRNVGLTANDCGLHLSIAEIEDKKASRILLTTTPADVMAFLDLDGDAYNRGFTTEEEIFRWCAAGRFFDPFPFQQKVDSAKDRQRLKKRPMFGRFVREWLPARPEYHDRKGPTRNDVLEEVFVTFGVRKEYEKRMERRVSDDRHTLK